MTTTPITIEPGVLMQAGTASLLTSPMTGAVQVLNATFANNGAGVNFISVYVVRSGGAPGAANLVVPNQAIPPGGTFVSPELWGRNLAAGDTLWGFATNASEVMCMIDGVGFS